MHFETIQVETDKAVGIIRLNRPEARNALDMVMRVELRTALQDFEDDTEIRAVVLTGQDPAFCSGGDLRTMMEQEPGKGYRRLHNVQLIVKLMRDMSTPIIASVNGAAFGAGWCMALAADFIIASEKATFAQAFVNVGLVPDLGSMYLLPRVVGIQKAKELMMTGRPIYSTEAYDLGIINQVVPHGELWTATMELAVKLAEGPPLALAYMKNVLNQTFEQDFKTVLEYEAFAQDSCFQTQDHKEGLQAFFDKRQPKFTGK